MVLAALAAGALISERPVSLIIDIAVPPMSDFNEYRWVIMAPWGRAGIAAGVASPWSSLLFTPPNESTTPTSTHGPPARW